VYRHGRAFNVDELLERSTGTAFNIAPYVRYLENKYTELYKLN
jgi:carboxypeptidase Taq